MKKINSVALSAFVAGCLCMLPQNASAYKYYVTLNNGMTAVIHAKDKAQAYTIYKSKYADKGILTSRPNGGLIFPKIGGKKYYVTSNSGKTSVLRAPNKEEAKKNFKSNFHDSILTSRPNGGLIDKN